VGLSEQQTRQGTHYNRLAIASLALATLTVIGTAIASVAVLAVFAVGTGHASLSQIKERGERGRGLALTALVIGYGIAALALVSTIYFAAVFSIQQ
jgi:multisubunit Na+/H+ antiporter MnhC subunit